MMVIQFGGASGSGFLSTPRPKPPTKHSRPKASSRAAFSPGSMKTAKAQHGWIGGLLRGSNRQEACFAEPRYDDVVVMNPDAYQWVETGTPGVSTKLLGTFTERNTQIGFIKVDAGATFNTGSRSQIEVLFMSRGNVTVNGRTYGEKTTIELLPSDGPVDIKANEESLFFTVTLPKL